MIQFLTLSVAGLAGSGAGWFSAPLTTRYCGPVTRHRRIVLAALGGAVTVMLTWRLGMGVELLAFCYLGVVGSLLAVIDIAVKRLPDFFTLPSYGVGIVLLGMAAFFVADGMFRFVHALLGMAALWFCYAVQHYLRPDAMGRGDVKLAGVIGLHLGWLGQAEWVTGAMAGLLLGGLFGITCMLLGRVGRKDEMPFGPFMLAGALLGVMSGGVLA
ncbi:leader peptidase (prepilin peptidase) / N-methyltransferase [Thermomonospora echinospora]|uniref:Leader peptidase (Prepilin peptidase) / N-methyltransferase n=1 Tax=Thermomonospora echinospora TaxID=1992 RepID=A0A1H6A647_9ACTN|nr:A24 family peptidase [Thermomonospora echinospora]SEG43507.1 leader peptidase (prepilin peptidase) / N-methyltransferase [Thermomonospora echinospora]